MLCVSVRECFKKNGNALIFSNIVLDLVMIYDLQPSFSLMERDNIANIKNYNEIKISISISRKYTKIDKD